MEVGWVDVEWVIRLAFGLSGIVAMLLFIATAVFVRSLYLLDRKMRRISDLTRKIEEGTIKLVAGIATWRHASWLRK